MFTEMITSLQNNIFPHASSIRGRLNVALIKKEAVLQLPKNFRVADPKINPRADHMTWAAVLLADKDLFEITTTILLTEISIDQVTIRLSQKDNTATIQKTLTELISLPANEMIKEQINSNIKKISAFEMFP